MVSTKMSSASEFSSLSSSLCSVDDGSSGFGVSSSESGFEPGCKSLENRIFGSSARTSNNLKSQMQKTICSQNSEEWLPLPHASPPLWRLALWKQSLRLENALCFQRLRFQKPLSCRAPVLLRLHGSVRDQQNCESSRMHRSGSPRHPEQLYPHPLSF